MTQLNREFIRNLKELRNRQRITQEKLAEVAGISSNYIGEIESGRKFPSTTVIEKLARALKTRPYRMFMSEDDLSNVVRSNNVYPLSDDARCAMVKEIEGIITRYSPGSSGKK